MKELEEFLSVKAMKAAVFKEQNKPLVIEEVPTPVPQEGEILVKVVACGVCGTDLHYIDHGTPTFKKPPIILGHEASGIVEIGGEIFKKGQRVLIPSVITCGACDFCKQGRENLCKKMIMPGNYIDGAYAEFIKVPEKDVILMPDEISLEDGCIISDAISTPYHAVVNRAKVRDGEKILVIGCGGVGINVVQIASVFGAEVIVCDTDDKKLEIALELGAKYAFNPNKVSAKDFLKQNNLKIDVAFEVIGKAETIETAYKSLGIGGRLCVVGYTNQNITINPAKIMFFEQEIIGSIGCKPSAYQEIFKLVLDGKIKLDKIISNKYELDDINTAFDELRSSKVLRNIILPNGKKQDPMFL
jgi:6-hydroxycyclohex-1-ene-1-carbonyl-CoA dehydrogenase